ncbi:MAG: acetyl-CoA carboxylase biotin carboxyl carrier protein [Phycisphaerales bacterium]|jgi:acetyl-CoA carboxylase biotin carboxyl carrier protein|nr:acetyl-CoA carboxylase biotin carboxyl carrier protein [Phycisphaerales bacterium]
MIDIRKLKELVKLMVQNDLTEMDLRDSEEQVTLQRPNQFAAPQVQQVAAAPAVTAPPPAAAPAPAAPPAAAPAAAPPPAGDREGLVAIESPMVGTFYAAASPDAAAFVDTGNVIAVDDVVCLIEAMKIFNEIKSEIGGTVEKVLVKNGDAVEFGQELMLVRPA